ncbi:MAG: undecaprenyl-phosphate glucose phosphotransferase [Chryseobacterium sp.]|nr:MAG: undecaprenyl-phosphate glucose phosphotransferase [Chryseobacterium sp.]
MPVYFIKHLPKIFMIGDYTIINLFFILGKLCFFELYGEVLFDQDYKVQFVLLNFSWFIITTITRLYRSFSFKESSLQFNALTKSLILFIIFSLVYLNLVFSVKVNYRSLISYFLFTGFFMVVTRVILFLYRKRNRVKIGRKLYSLNTVLVGENKFSLSLLSNNEMRRSMGIRGAYAIDDNCSTKKYLGGVNQLFEDLENVKINNIIFCDDRIDIDLYKNIVEVAEHKMIRIYMVPDFKYVSIGPHHFDSINQIPFLKLLKEPLSAPKKQVLKRIFDILFSSLVLIFILSWLMPIVAIIIKLESKGPVFFLQKRSGFKNEPFNCIKFRSMSVNSYSDVMSASKNDSRVTKFGSFMRKTSIDELPQFVNVFLGHMSVVGPRPHMLSQTEQYAKITKKYMLRHIVKPGITGWAQVMGSRGEIFSNKDMENRVEKDIWYIQNWSFFLDLKIIFLTFYNIVKGDEQAY